MKTVLLIFLLISVPCVIPTHLETKYQWKYFDYNWSPNTRNAYIQFKVYNPKNLIPIDVDQSKDGRTFVTIRTTEGVPASLHTVTNEVGPSGPLLQPYPDWTWHKKNICSNIISAYRIAFDRCNRMWVLDTGIIDNKKVCQAKLLAFDLNTDTLLKIIVIGKKNGRITSENGLLVTPIVEAYGKMCRDTRVYMADIDGNGLVVWENNRLFRLNADVFKPEEENANFMIADRSFSLPDGVLGMAISPGKFSFVNRYLTFRPLASKSLYTVHTKFLRYNTNPFAINYTITKNVLPSEATAQVYSAGGILFYTLTHEMAIGCWNMNRPLERNYLGIVLRDSKLQFAKSMKVAYNLQGNEQLLIMTNRFQNISTNTMDITENNFHVVSASVRSLITGTICDNVKI